MTVAEFGLRLKALTMNDKPMKFAAYSWQSAPKGDYGLYGQYGADQFEANNRYGEHATQIFVDWFTRSDDESGKDAIESLFKEIQDEGAMAWYLNTVQFDRDTGFLHYEWNVELV